VFSVLNAQKTEVTTNIDETWVQKTLSDGRPTAHWLKGIHTVM
jgi:hypothetical protein